MSIEITASELSFISPFDDVTTAFETFVQEAEKSIDINIYGYTLQKLTDIIIAKHKAGVRISMILDHTQSAGKAEKTQVEQLIAAGVPVLIGTSPVHGAILHGKWTVIDDIHVAHGSWNYSESAQYQLNDFHIKHNNPQFAQFYLQAHDRVLSFVKLHDMLYQPAGEIEAAAALPQEATNGQSS